MKPSSVTELLKRKADNARKKSVTIELNDICLTGELLSLPHVLSITDEYDTDTKLGGMQLALELIYMTFPIFRSKEIREQNEHSEPHDIVLDILTMGEIQTVMNELNKHYGVNQEEQVKKQ